MGLVPSCFSAGSASSCFATRCNGYCRAFRPCIPHVAIPRRQARAHTWLPSPLVQALTRGPLWLARASTACAYCNTCLPAAHTSEQRQQTVCRPAQALLAPFPTGPLSCRRRAQGLLAARATLGIRCPRHPCMPARRTLQNRQYHRHIPTSVYRMTILYAWVSNRPVDSLRPQRYSCFALPANSRRIPARQQCIRHLTHVMTRPRLGLQR